MTSKDRDATGYHDDFKIISRGRELPYPMLRILSLVVLAFVWGFSTARVWP